jgi:hypothetical protein
MGCFHHVVLHKRRKPTVIVKVYCIKGCLVPWKKNYGVTSHVSWNVGRAV